MKSPEKHSLFKQNNETFGRVASPNIVPIPDASKLSYLDALSVQIWQLFIEKRQTPATYARKAHFKNALHMIISSVFESKCIFRHFHKTGLALNFYPFFCRFKNLPSWILVKWIWFGL